MKTFASIVAFVISVQCAVITYWATRKSNYFVDELYTFETTQDFLKGENRVKYISKMDSWKDEEWISVEPFKERLVLDKDESVMSLPFAKALSGFFKGRNYMWILNALESVFSPGKMSRWPSFWFNLIVFILTQILLCLLLQSLSVDRGRMILALLLYGLCPLTISTVIYVRFYAWTIFLCLCAVSLHWVMWKDERPWVHLACEAAGLLCLYLAFKNSELVLIFGGALIVFFSIGLLIRKRYSQMLYYSVPAVVIGLWYVGVHTELLSIMLHPGDYTSSDGATGLVSNAFLSVTPIDLAHRGSKAFRMLCGHGFCSLYIALALIVILLAVSGSYRKDKGGHVGGFVVIMVSTGIMFVLFLMLTDLVILRYLAFPLLVLVVAVWALAGRMKALGANRPLRILLAAIIAVACVLPFFNNKVKYVYREDKPLISSLKDYDDLDRVLAVEVNANAARESHEQECVFWCPDEVSMYLIPSGIPSHTIPDCPERFLFWIGTDMDAGPVTEMLGEQGYNLSLLGTTHISTVYLCETVRK